MLHLFQIWFAIHVQQDDKHIHTQLLQLKDVLATLSTHLCVQVDDPRCTIGCNLGIVPEPDPAGLRVTGVTHTETIIAR